MFAAPEVAECLVDKCPESVRVRDNDGQLPLHVAARYVGLDEVIILAERWGAALLEKDHAGRLPLHHAVQYEAPLRVVRYLVDEGPLALQKRTADGYLPLHWAVRWKAPAEVAQILVDKYRGALSERTDDGLLPLHVAAQRHRSVEFISSFSSPRLRGPCTKKDDGRVPRVARCCSVRRRVGCHLLPRSGPGRRRSARVVGRRARSGYRSAFAGSYRSFL
jgi:ankyrin repeat protein